MSHLLTFLYCFSTFAVLVLSNFNLNSLSSFDPPTSLSLRRQLADPSNTTDSSQASTIASDNGAVLDPDPDADISTWFPSDTNADEVEQDAGPSPNETAKRAPLIKDNTIAWTNESTSTDYNYTFSGCASVGRQVLGPWTFYNNSNTSAATWVDIYRDALLNGHSFKSIQAALDDGIKRNIAVNEQNLSTMVGGLFYDDTVPGTSSQSGLLASQRNPTLLDKGLIDYGTGHNELRKLLSENWVPSQSALIFVAVSAALNYGLITGFSILGSKVNGDNITFANHASGIGAALVFTSIAVTGWVLSPKLRAAINSLTASGVVATVRETTNRITNEVLGRSTSEGSYNVNADAIVDGNTLPGADSVFSSDLAGQLNHHVNAPITELQPLSTLQRVGSWLSDLDAADVEGIEPLQQVRNTASGQTGLGAQCAV